MHASKDCVDKYGNRLYVVDPELVDDGDASGNAFLIKEYFARKISSIDDLNFDIK